MHERVVTIQAQETGRVPAWLKKIEMPRHRQRAVLSFFGGIFMSGFLHGTVWVGMRHHHLLSCCFSSWRCLCMPRMAHQIVERSCSDPLPAGDGRGWLRGGNKRVAHGNANLS
ncbi:unnamed protein product [Ectocarpus fasciculatus]